MDQSLLRTHVADVEDVTGHGDWYPVKVIDTYYAPPHPVLGVGATPTPTPTWTDEITIDHVVVNPTFKDEEFSLAALGLDEGQALMQFNEKDKRTVMTWSGGALHRPQ
jgi:hypothetical protein